MKRISTSEILPADRNATLIGRVWRDDVDGPCPVMIDGEDVRDLSAIGLTISAVINAELDHEIERSRFPVIGRLEEFLSGNGRRERRGSLLAPCDLQVVKAAGVTFVESMLERVIEERAKGEAQLG